jgi:hypothetical protein
MNFTPSLVLDINLINSLPGDIIVMLENNDFYEVEVKKPYIQEKLWGFISNIATLQPWCLLILNKDNQQLIKPIKLKRYFDYSRIYVYKKGPSDITLELISTDNKPSCITLEYHDLKKFVKNKYLNDFNLITDEWVFFNDKKHSLENYFQHQKLLNLKT